MSAPPEKCPFDRAWLSRCIVPPLDGSEFCAAHSALRCAACGKQAVRDCDATYALVCGTPLCASCQCPPCRVIWERRDAEEVAEILMDEPGRPRMRSPV